MLSIGIAGISYALGTGWVLAIERSILSGDAPIPVLDVSTILDARLFWVQYRFSVKN